MSTTATTIAINSSSSSRKTAASAGEKGDLLPVPMISNSRTTAQFLYTWNNTALKIYQKYRFVYQATTVPLLKLRTQQIQIMKLTLSVCLHIKLKE
jgi:hypothetical protein